MKILGLNPSSGKPKNFCSFHRNTPTETFLGLEGWRFTFVLTGAFGLFVGLSALPSLDGSERLRGLGDSAKDQWHLMELVRGRKRKEEDRMAMGVCS